MNSTKAFLFQQLSDSQSLEEFYLCFNAIRRLDALIGQATAQQERQAAATMPLPIGGQQPRPFGEQPGRGFAIGQNAGIPPHVQPPAGFRPNEVAPDFDSMPAWFPQEG